MATHLPASDTISAEAEKELYKGLSKVRSRAAIIQEQLDYVALRRSVHGAMIAELTEAMTELSKTITNLFPEEKG